jgi:hypothetical protein
MLQHQSMNQRYYDIRIDTTISINNGTTIPFLNQRDYGPMTILNLKEPMILSLLNQINNNKVSHIFTISTYKNI